MNVVLREPSCCQNEKPKLPKECTFERADMSERKTKMHLWESRHVVKIGDHNLLKNVVFESCHVRKKDIKLPNNAILGEPSSCLNGRQHPNKECTFGRIIFCRNGRPQPPFRMHFWESRHVVRMEDHNLPKKVLLWQPWYFQNRRTHPSKECTLREPTCCQNGKPQPLKECTFWRAIMFSELKTTIS